MDETLSEILIDTRTKNGDSLRAASEKISVSLSYLSSLEKGERTNPSIKILKRIADGYKLDFINLLRVCGLNDEIEQIKNGELDPEIFSSSKENAPKIVINQVGEAELQKISIDYLLLSDNEDKNIEIYWKNQKLTSEDKKTMYQILKTLIDYKY